ncbi:MAG: hypothetical protein IPJ13_02890 [Saprospiraceae bacterium]|nr:hypothetical protein [Saprospiraceae bacterium]
MKTSTIFILLFGISYLAVCTLSIIQAPLNLKRKSHYNKTNFTTSFEPCQNMELIDNAFVKILHNESNQINTSSNLVKASLNNFVQFKYNTLILKSVRGNTTINSDSAHIQALSQIKAHQFSELEIDHPFWSRLNLDIDQSTVTIKNNQNIRYLKVDMKNAAKLTLSNCKIDTLVLNKDNAEFIKENTIIDVFVEK